MCEHMVVKVFKPDVIPKAKRRGGRVPVVPHNEVAGTWGPAKFTKQLMCYWVNYRGILEAWAQAQHRTVCRGA